MKMTPRGLLVLAVVEFFLVLPLFFLIFPAYSDFGRGYNPEKINFSSPAIISFYLLVIVIFLQIFISSREIKSKKLSNLLRQTSIVSTILFCVIVFYAFQTAFIKISQGKSIFYNDSGDCRYYTRTHPFYLLKPSEQHPKNC